MLLGQDSNLQPLVPCEVGVVMRTRHMWLGGFTVPRLSLESTAQSCVRDVHRPSNAS